MYAAAKTLYATPRQTIQEDVVATIHAECMLMAFACELFIKTMLYYENRGEKKIEGHFLKELFEKLSDQTKKTIVDAFNEKWHDDKIEIYCCLEKITHYFVDLRYLFEKESESYTLYTGLLFSFADVLRWRCEAGKSAWSDDSTNEKS